jgi:cardiolipin synthase
LSIRLTEKLCKDSIIIYPFVIRIIVPHIPDKRLVFGITRSFYKRLLDVGVRIYEYTPGFIHAKSYIADDEYAMIGKS